jgi:hypothetical protein
MNTKNTKTSSQIRDEVQEDIKKVSQDLNKIQKRMTPGQIIDDLIYYPNGANQQGVLQHLKENPVGASFLTIGTLLLMEDETHLSYEEVIKQKTGHSLVKLKSNYKNYEEVIKRDTGESLDALKAKYQNTKARMRQSAGKAKNLPPLSYVALGVGLGALSGASLPVSDKETSIVIDKLGDQMSSLVQEFNTAFHDSANLVKNEFVNLLKDVDVNILMGSS